ncbi:MAG: 3'-5' exonuclease [Muribaculaceae bacterium]
MDKFIAIDVETANFNPSSICAIGAAKVIDGMVADTRYSLVCPEPEWYSYACTQVHGLTQKDTYDAPSFGRVWQEWADWLDGFTLVAHNAPFDSKCIREACKIYRLEPPGPFMCTLAAARRQIPRGMCASNSLDSLCNFFGITLKNHHNALDDAVACAKLGIILL